MDSHSGLEEASPHKSHGFLDFFRAGVDPRPRPILSVSPVFSASQVCLDKFIAACGELPSLEEFYDLIRIVKFVLLLIFVDCRHSPPPQVPNPTQVGPTHSPKPNPTIVRIHSTILSVFTWVTYRRGCWVLAASLKALTAMFAICNAATRSGDELVRFWNVYKSFNWT